MAKVKLKLSQFSKQRRNIRYQPDPLTVAWIDPLSSGGTFKPKLKALVFSESYSGCGLVGLTADFFNIDSSFRIKVGDVLPLRAEIAWVRELDQDVCKLGIRYLDAEEE